MFRPENDGFQYATLENNGFWPDLALDEFQRQRSIPPSIDQETIKQALLTSVTAINDELQGVATEKQKKGYATAQDVPGVRMGADNSLVAQYKKAVFARAKADLMGEFAAVSRRDENTNQDAPQTKASLLAEASFVLRSMKGKKRVGINLI